MNLLKNISLIAIILLIVISCKKEDDMSSLNNVAAPTNLVVGYDVTQDNTGLVTIVPTAEGVTKFLVTFGDVADEVPSEYGLNETITHIYTEGVYTVGVTAKGLTGKSTSVEDDLNIIFKAPENLDVTIEPDVVNPRIISVSATADFATVMDVYFGYVDPEEPTTVLPGEPAIHEYEEPGDYEIRVVAKSAGVATTEYKETITISPASDPVNLPIDFESFTVNYAFENFGDATSTVIDNPDQSGINTSDRVAQMVKAEGAQTWAGSFLTLETPIDFSVKKAFKVKVWSPKTDAVVKLKVENLTNGEIGFEVDALTTVSNEWEELSYDFSAIDISKEYQKVVIFFDFDNPGDGTIYYFDDIKQVVASVPPTQMIEDFEGEPPVFTAFGDAAAQVIANPDPSGINTSANVAEMSKPEGAQTWAGAYFDASGPLDLDSYSKIGVKVWSPKSGIAVRLKIENSANDEEFYEADMSPTTANAWEELVWDVTDAPDFTYDRIVLFFDFDVPGDGSLYYFDEVQLVSEGGGGVTPLVFQDFEGEPPVFTAFGDAATQVIANPDQSGINISANVAEMIKPDGAQTWAGSYFDVAAPLDLDTYSKISLKVWSPKSGITVRFKMENSANDEEFYEADMSPTTANAWEELVYDVSEAPDFTYDRIVIFFDFDVPGDGSIYYYDDYTLTN